MAANVTKMSGLMAVTCNNGQVLGKFVYFSLSNILVERDELTAICDSIGLPYATSSRLSDSNAFRSATGDIYDRVVDGTQIYKVFCRDNERQGSVISRELVKETLGASTNHYTKLANISLDTEGNLFGYDNVSYDSVINPYIYCEQAQALFEKYKRCAGRKQIETLALNFLEQMQAIKISIHGRLYFVPNSQMHQVTLFEDFIESLNDHNQNVTPLVVNSMFVMDDEKQRKKMAAEFYNAVKKEIEEYQERAEHLISTDSQSPAIMGRWVLKIEALEHKKQEYEGILRQQLDQLDSEFQILRMFSQELQIRSRKLEMKRAA